MVLDSIRVSELQRAMSCELSFFYSRTRKVEFKSVAMLMGSLVHKCLQDYFQTVLDGGNRADWGVMNSLLEQYFDHDKDGVDFSKVSELQARETAKHYLFTYHQKRCRLLYPLSVERQFKVKVKQGDRELVISGIIDLITTSMNIIDYKTTSSVSSWTQGRADAELQSALYPYLAKTHNLEIAGFEYDVFSGKDLKIYPVEFNMRKVTDAVRFAFRLQDTLENYPESLLSSKSKFVCNCCNWKDECDKRRI